MRPARVWMALGIRRSPIAASGRQPQVAGVRVGGERHVLAIGLVGRPDELTQPPRDRRTREEDPRAPVGVASGRREQAPGRACEGRNDEPHVRDRPRRRVSADVEHEQRGPRCRDRGGNPAREDVPGFERPRTTLHDHVSTEPPNVGYPLRGHSTNGPVRGRGPTSRPPSCRRPPPRPRGAGRADTRRPSRRARAP